MDSTTENSRFLKEKFPSLHASHESVSAARHTKQLTGEFVSQKPENRIDNLLERYEQFAFNPEKRERLKHVVMQEYIHSNKEKLAKGAAQVEERAARQLGIDVHYGEDELQVRGDIAVEDLEKSLDQWINYFSDPNEPYASWFRYYAFRSVLGLGRWDKDAEKFPKRSPGTNLLFPDIDRGALGYVQDMISAAVEPNILKKIQKGQEEMGTPDEELLTQQKVNEFTKLSFAEQYAEGIKQKGEITLEMREETRGMWITHKKGSDPTELWKSLQNKGTAWCTAGFGTAKSQLEGGDFHVYYTLDRHGNPTIPRIAIRMQEGVIFEARGVADNQQNIEGNMVDIAEQKIDQLPGSEKYRKVSADMKQLTEIENRLKQGHDLSQTELIFLYEINSPIEGFGYEKDPRIEEIRSTRDSKTDAPIVFDCEPIQIAWGTSDIINENTKAYVGPLFPGIFKLLPDSIPIYTSFPESQVERETLTIGGMTSDQLQKELETKKIGVGSFSKSMMRNKDFETKATPEDLSLIRLTVADLGFSDGATTDEIYAKAKSLGLKLCPSETGQYLLLKYKNHISYDSSEWFYIGMKPISDADGYKNIFVLGMDGNDSFLSARPAGSDDGWSIDRKFAFCL